MPVNKTLAALEKVAAALEPLEPEERRRVIEAVHTLLEISSGMESGCGGEMGGGWSGGGEPGSQQRLPAPARPASKPRRR